MKKQNLSGMFFGRWTVKAQAETLNTKVMWVCQCECGTISNVSSMALTKGTSKSCGCLNREKTIERNLKHGAASRKNKIPEYSIWLSMRDRCNNPRNKYYSRYGGRGIEVSSRWDSFEMFLKDMGCRPSKKHSLDRIDNDKGYNPDNCRWATDIEQGRNKRNNISIQYNGNTYSALSELSGLMHTSLRVSAVRWRINNGWDVHMALTTPSTKQK